MPILYLSQIVLSGPQRRKLQTANSYELHQLLRKAFHTGNERQTRNFLYRADHKPHHTHILVHSQNEPDWSQIFNPTEWEVKCYTPQFREGQAFSFYLRANAVIAERKLPGQRSKKRPLTATEYLHRVWYSSKGEIESMEHNQGWIFRQSKQHGFSLIDVDTLGQALASGVKTFKNLKHHALSQQYNSETNHCQASHSSSAPNFIRHTGQNLRGTLQITDVEKFGSIYVSGLGRGKAFGFGMLSLLRR